MYYCIVFHNINLAVCGGVVGDGEVLQLLDRVVRCRVARATLVNHIRGLNKSYMKKFVLKKYFCMKQYPRNIILVQ